jgi:hypothetical protein
LIDAYITDCVKAVHNRYILQKDIISPSSQYITKPFLKREKSEKWLEHHTQLRMTSYKIKLDTKEIELLICALEASLDSARHIYDMESETEQIDALETQRHKAILIQKLKQYATCRHM